MNLKEIKYILLFTVFGTTLMAQSNNSELPTSINNTGLAPDASAILDVQSTNKGVLIPRVTAAQMTAISSPATGLLVYNTTAASFYFFDGIVWTDLSGGGSGGPTNQILDADFDTKVEVDDGTDHDKIKFKVSDGAGGSIEAFTIEHDPALNLKNSRLSNDGYDNNLFIGFETGLVNEADHGTNYGYNTFVGVRAGKANTIGYSNSFLGAYSGTANITGSGNSFFGHYAGGFNTDGDHNVFMGLYSGYENTTGSSNVFLGYLAGYKNIIADRSVGIGHGALQNNDTGSTIFYHGENNVAVGYHAGNKNTLGDDNVFLGFLSGEHNTEGRFNTYLGAHTGKANILGLRNVNIGHGAARYSTDGDDNVLIGVGAGNSNDQDDNVMLGAYAGSNNDGEKNVFLGYNAGYSSGTGDRNVFVGYQAGRNETGSDKLYIENSATASPLIFGDFSSNILRTNGTLQVSNPSVSGYAFPTSDGAAGQMMITNGSGALAWTTPSTSPWQYNSGTNDIYTTIDHVGIGTGSPNALLHLSTGSAEPKAIVINNTNSNGTGLQIDMDATNQNSSSVKGILSQAQPKAYAGYFDGRLEATTVLNLEEKSTAPTNANSYAGDVYMDDGSNTNNSQRGLRYFDGSTWNDVESETVSFSAYPTSSVPTTSGISKGLTGFTERFDEGNNFDSAGGEFTAPSDGIYQFHLKVAWDAAADTPDKRMVLRIRVNGTIEDQLNVVIPIQATFNNTTQFSPILELDSNDKVTAEVLQYSGGNIDVFGSTNDSSSRFNGYKIK